MDEATGWPLDVYADEQGGVAFWLLTDTCTPWHRPLGQVCARCKCDDQRLRLRMDFSVTFYSTGEFSLLR